MYLLETIVKTLNKPFPEDGRFGSIKNITVISVFVIFILYVFQPFGISTIESGKFLICLGFGSMTFMSSIIYEFIISQLFKLKGERGKWTFGKWILNNLAIMFFISLANFLYARILIIGYIEWELFPHMIYGTFMIGIIPIVVLGWLSLNKQEKKYQNIAEEINQQKVMNPSRNSDEESIFDIPVSQIKFVEALQNYVQIGYFNFEGKFIKQTKRATLKQILNETQESSIVKCHRSFLVNRKAIISASGNAQGLLLQLSDCDTIIPVSRSYVSIFRNN